jgi:N-acetylglutamate synthase-like GNAT family acetyltransferase
MFDVTLRSATQIDVPALHRLVERAYRGDAARQGWTHEADLLDGQRTDPELLAEVLATPGTAVLLAERAGVLAGCAKVEVAGGQRAHLGMLAVEPTAQAAGLGRVLIEAAEAHARAVLNATVMEMTVIAQRPELIAYYERRGYLRTGLTAPFPLDDARFGLPRTRELVFEVLEKRL